MTTATIRKINEKKRDAKVSLNVSEYRRLKTLEKRFGDFFDYMSHLSDILEARREIRKGEIISQEKLFRRLGI